MSPPIHPLTLRCRLETHSMLSAEDLKLKPADVEALEKKVEGIKVIRDFISKEEEQQIINAIDENPWSAEIKRRTQQYGAKYNYRTQGASNKRELEVEEKVAPIPDSLEFVTKRLLERNVYSEAHPPDQLIINEYTKGQGIVHHIDAVKLWGPTVTTLSVGSPAVMEFKKPKKNDPTGSQSIEIILEPRSLVILTGPSRYNWQHGISKNVSFMWQGEKYTRLEDYRRISLTFRTIAFEKANTNSDEEAEEVAEENTKGKKAKT